MNLVMGIPVDVGGILPGTYKMRFVPNGNIKSQWWPNAADPAHAQAITFNAGESVNDIFFFAESGSIIFGSVVMNDYSSGTILIGVFTDAALTQLVRGTEIDGQGVFTIEGLEPGTYYVAAVLDANGNGQPDVDEPAATAGIFPVVVSEGIEATAGIINLGDNGGVLNGTVALGTGVTAEGTIYVGVFSDADMTQIAGGATLTAPGAFAIQNLPPATYYVGAYMDVDGDNPFPSEPGLEDPMGDASGNSVVVTTGTTVDAGTITLIYESSQVDAWSQNWHNGQQYVVHFEVGDPNHTATSVTIAGPGITGSLSLDYYDTDEGAWNSWQSTGGSLDFGNNPPTPLLNIRLLLSILQKQMFILTRSRVLLMCMPLTYHHPAERP